MDIFNGAWDIYKNLPEWAKIVIVAVPAMGIGHATGRSEANKEHALKEGAAAAERAAMMQSLALLGNQTGAPKIAAGREERKPAVSTPPAARELKAESPGDGPIDRITNELRGRITSSGREVAAT